MPKTAIGRTVQYTLTPADVESINRRRTTGEEIADRIANNGAELASLTNLPDTWPTGAQAHIGNSVYAGEILPALIVKVWKDEFGSGVDGVNLQVFLDGNDQYWVSSIAEAPEPENGKFNWPLLG